MDDKLNELRKIAECGIHIESNIHKDMYETAEQYYGEYIADHFYNTVGKIDYEKDIWTIQVYPKTPVGFIAGISNDLDSLINWAIKVTANY